MAKSSKHVVIEGQYASGVLGAFRIIRGFATLQDLAEISAPFEMAAAAGVPVQGHQRTVSPGHAEEIKRYLQDGKLRFIPEIILSVRGAFRDELNDQQRPVGVIANAGDGLLIRRRWRSENIQVHEIRVSRHELPKLLAANRIRRIDGNHRLHLAKELALDPRMATKYLAPFCAVLLAPPGDANDDYVESMLFHTINSTALPLDSEHALRLILGQAPGFGQTPDEELAMSAPLHLTRLLKTPIDALPAPQKARLGTTPNTVLYASAKAILAENPQIKADQNAIQTFATGMSGALNDILARLPAIVPEFCKADFFIELVALAWQQCTTGTHDERVNASVKTLEGMAQWLGRDGMDGIQGNGVRSLGIQLFELYKLVRNRVPKRIFLARWYPQATDGDELNKANLRKRGIDRAIQDLAREGIQLTLDDPGTQVGSTFPIHKDMYDAIARNDIILIDLSGVRPNVCVEAANSKGSGVLDLLIAARGTDVKDSQPAL